MADEGARARIGWGKWIAGAVAVAAGGAAFVYYKRRQAQAPRYELLSAEGAFELRRYPAMLAIETIQKGSRDRALGNGFGLLAAYMFGTARGEGAATDEIAIGLPILAAPAGAGQWRIRFLLPEGMTRAQAPAPGAGVALIDLPAREVAALKLAGKGDDRLFREGAAELLGWVEGRGLIAGAVEHAHYNSPLKPGVVRQDELLVAVERE